MTSQVRPNCCHEINILSHLTSKVFNLGLSLDVQIFFSVCSVITFFRRHLGKARLETPNYLVSHDYVIILIHSDYFGKFEFCPTPHSEHYNATAQVFSVMESPGSYNLAIFYFRNFEVVRHKNIDYGSYHLI